MTQSSRLHTTQSEKHSKVAGSFHNIAVVFITQGQLDEVLKVYNKALQIRRRVLGEDNQDESKSFESIGTTHFKQGRHYDALEMFQEALSTY